MPAKKRSKVASNQIDEFARLVDVEYRIAPEFYVVPMEPMHGDGRFEFFRALARHFIRERKRLYYNLKRNEGGWRQVKERYDGIWDQVSLEDLPKDHEDLVKLNKIFEFGNKRATAAKDAIKAFDEDPMVTEFKEWHRHTKQSKTYHSGALAFQKTAEERLDTMRKKRKALDEKLEALKVQDVRDFVQ